jgi:CheY-like chemotaxis protein
VERTEERLTRVDGETGSVGPEEQEADGGERQLPLALLLYTDLMFGVQLQNMARKAGYRVASFRSGTLPTGGDLLVVDLSARVDLEEGIRQARTRGIPVVAFGPHMDTESRRKAKAAGASRVLANSNLARDLPAILLELRHAQDVTPAGGEGA